MWMRALAYLVAVSALGACAMAEVTPEGGQVATTQDPLPSTCVRLGEVTGKGGGGPGGAYISNASLVEYARNDVRNQAAALGATDVRMGSPMLGSGNGTTNSATITGTAYRCGAGAEATTIRTAAAPAADPDPLLIEVQKHPKWPELGATALEAKALCEHQRGQWVNQQQKIGCLVLREKIFACQLGDASIVRVCTHWKLGADTTDERDAIIDKKGKPTSTATDGGFRTFVWQLPDETITLAGTASGVVVTNAKALATPPPTAPSRRRPPRRACGSALVNPKPPPRLAVNPRDCVRVGRVEKGLGVSPACPTPTKRTEPGAPEAG